MAEPILPDITSALIPITALAFLQLGTCEPFLLAGEGQSLKVFSGEGGKLVCKERVFDSQAIHGIACEASPPGVGIRGISLIWGGRSICLVSIELDVEINGETSVKVRQLMPEVLWDDWIHDGCFVPEDVTDRGSGSNIIEALLVTAHNDLLHLKFVAEAAETGGSHWLNHIASGPNSILYSAHMLWADAGCRLLIAAGTVFGEVLFWSFTFDRSESSEVHVHHVFTGHEGSVFGVRISEVAQTSDVKRILASCSDDRTIRIWNVSENAKGKELPNGKSKKPEVDLEEETNGARSTACLAMIMGHASRIWGLRFLNQKDELWDLMSYGEDSTAQAWQVSPVPVEDPTLVTPHKPTYQLSHQTTYSYHTGKNMWAMAVFRESDTDCVIATGGADGRIIVHTPVLHKIPARAATWTSQYTMDEVLKTFQTTSSRMSSTENIYCSLKGSWKLSRNLDSALSTYPSGNLNGIATFAERPPSEDDYDAEYLYSESGDFTTQQGLTMKATRRYVYRYSRKRDVISVWFVKPDDGSTVDYFFHQLDFPETNSRMDSGSEVHAANGYHLCVDDNYNSGYSFRLSDSKITQWHAIFDVHGPKKDYTAKATYTRDQAECVESENPENVIPPSKTRIRALLGSQGEGSKPDTFKTYSWISENGFLTTTEHGNLFVGTLTFNTKTDSPDYSRIVTWEHVGHQMGLISCSIVTSIASLGIALLTGSDGVIYLYNHGNRAIHVIGKLPSKAGFLKAHTLSEPWKRWLRLSHQREMIGVLAACLGSSQAKLFTLSPDIHAKGQSKEKEVGFPAIHECSLTLPFRFIMTSSCFLKTEKCIILGSRNGEIAMYNMAHATPNLAVDVTPKCFPNIHTEDAITSIQNIPRDISKLTEKTAIMTTGRDGKWAIHHLFHKSENGTPTLTLETIHVAAPPFGPNIEGARINSTSKDLFLWGFRSTHFVVWNESQKTEAMAVDCGGAHRNWSYTHSRDGRGGGTFVYTKASICHLHSQTSASHHVIQPGGHGREIKAVAVSPAIKSGNDHDPELRLLATGAEDTSIRIFNLNDPLRCLAVITKHTTGIQQLRWSPDGRVLFSAASCEELFAWRVQPAPLVTIGLVCTATCPPVTQDKDLRIMDFALHEHPPDHLLSTVYSDSSLRIFRHDSTSFTLLSTALYTTSCLTQITHLGLSEQLSALCTASTDGHLAFWPLPAHLSGTNDSMTPINWTARPLIHQSAIKSLLATPLSPTQTLLITAGDDGAIAFTRLRLPTAFKTHTLLLPNSHAGAVTALVLRPRTSDLTSQIEIENQNAAKKQKQCFTLASVGSDQRVRVWEVEIDMRVEGAGGIGVRRVSSRGVGTEVADAGGGVGWGDGDGFVVGGVGVEGWGWGIGG